MTSKQRLISASTALFILASALPALADTAPDATDFGPLATTSAEYKFPATIDPDIIGDRFTELWAVVYMPVDLSGGPYPLLVFKHGNHGTCGSCTAGSFVGYECFMGETQVARSDGSSAYTTSGTCPVNFVVTPNHLGYTYLAERLASWGYIVVSINSNRGITAGMGVAGDAGLNLARGRLILKHLQRLSEWNTNPGTTPVDLGVDLFGTIDFNNVGLMGHSRGGEGVRAAYNLYRDSGSPWPARIPNPLTFKAIFEIGAVDGQTSRILNPDGTVWNQLLPMCDGDVSNLQGVKPFDRTMQIFTESPATQKSTFTVWGTNHNYYNTEWQVSDSAGCTGAGNPPLFTPGASLGSPSQRQASLASVMAMFRANVGPGADATFNRNFNPMFDLPAVVTDVTRVDRAYTDSPASGLYPGAPTTVFEDFTQAALGTSEYGFTIDTFGLASYVKGSVPNHDVAARAALISWDTPGGYLETNWTDVGMGNDISGYATLDLRVSRQNSALNPPTPNITNFNLQLVMADGSASGEVPVSNYTQLTGPVGGAAGGLHPILQTARIPLVDFFGADLTQIRGVSLNFDDTPSGAIYVTNIRLSQIGAGTGANQELAQPNAVLGNTASNAPIEAPVYSDGNIVAQLTSSGSNGNQVMVEVYSATEIPITNSLLTMRIGNQESGITGFINGDTRNVAAWFDAGAFAQVNSGDPITIRYGSDSPVWSFGLLDKRLVNK